MPRYNCYEPPADGRLRSLSNSQFVNPTRKPEREVNLCQASVDVSKVVGRKMGCYHFLPSHARRTYPREINTRPVPHPVNKGVPEWLQMYNLLELLVKYRSRLSCRTINNALLPEFQQGRKLQIVHGRRQRDRLSLRVFEGEEGLRKDLVFQPPPLNDDLAD